MILLQIYYTKEGVKMKNKQINRTLSLLLSVVMVLSLCPLIAKAEGTKPNIKIGDYIKLGTYENEPILWRCVDIDDNGPLMLMDRCWEVCHMMPKPARTVRQDPIAVIVLEVVTVPTTGGIAICVRGLTQMLMQAR